MSLIIEINGRQAIPVRALSFLCHRQISEEDVAEALSGDVHQCFAKIRANRLINGVIEGVSQQEWANIILPRVSAAYDLDMQNRNGEVTVELPAAVFVWRDEWQMAYDLWPAIFDKPEKTTKYEEIDEYTLSLMSSGDRIVIGEVQEGEDNVSEPVEMRRPPDFIKEELNFDAWIPFACGEELVMQGFV